MIQYALTAGGVGEAPVHHAHVALLCGQDGPPRGQQDVAGRSPFQEGLEERRRHEEEKRPTHGENQEGRRRYLHKKKGLKVPAQLPCGHPGLIVGAIREKSRLKR